VPVFHQDWMAAHEADAAGDDHDDAEPEEGGHGYDSKTRNIHAFLQTIRRAKKLAAPAGRSSRPVSTSHRHAEPSETLSSITEV
jgi:hypothetical protein